MLYQNIIETIGSTPLVKINHLDPESAEIYVKLESFNPGGSTKDRPALYMIQAAEKAGLIKKGDTFIEATSGNMGIALSMIGAALGYKIVIVMPDTMSEERRRIVKAYGAELILTEGKLGMAGAVAKSEELAKAHDYFLIRQFENAANPEIHRITTAKEILADTEGKVDIFIAAVGTGGTITGTSEVLRAHNPNVKIIAVEPDASPVLSGGKPGPHKIQGIGAGFVPLVLNTKIYDEVVQVSNDDAIAASRALAQNEGLLVGISAGANAHVAALIAARPENKGKTIVTILCDTGERYLSSGLYDYDEE